MNALLFIFTIRITLGEVAAEAQANGWTKVVYNGTFADHIIERNGCPTYPIVIARVKETQEDANGVRTSSGFDVEAYSIDEARELIRPKLKYPERFMQSGRWKEDHGDLAKQVSAYALNSRKIKRRCAPPEEAPVPTAERAAPLKEKYAKQRGAFHKAIEWLDKLSGK